MSGFLKHKGVIFNITEYHFNMFSDRPESYLNAKIINAKQDKVVKDTWNKMYNFTGESLRKKDYAEPNSIAIIDGKYYNIINSFFNGSSNQKEHEMVLNFDFVELIKNIEFSEEEENEMRSLGGMSKFSL